MSDLGESVLRRPGELEPLEGAREASAAPVPGDNGQAVLGDAWVVVAHEARSNDDPAVIERDERTARHSRLVTEPVFERDPRRRRRSPVGVALVLCERVRLAKQLGAVGDRLTSTPSGTAPRVGRRGGRPPVRPRGPPAGSRTSPRTPATLDHRPTPQPFRNRAPRRAPSAGGAWPCRRRDGGHQDGRAGRRTSALDVGRSGEACPYDLSVERGDDHELVGSWRSRNSCTVQADSFGHAARLTRIQPSKSASVSAVRTSMLIPTSSACRGVSHSARRGGTFEAEGDRHIPITTSGQSSSPIAARPAPSMIASRIPSSA